VVDFSVSSCEFQVLLPEDWLVNSTFNQNKLNI
jgi:hypothetical protein